MFLQMAQNRKRVTQKAAWTKETLEMTIKAIRNGGTIWTVTMSFSIPSGTLQERISKGKSGNPKLGRNSLFTPGTGRKHCNTCYPSSHNVYVNPVQLHHIAFDFAEQNKMKYNFNRQNCAAGKDWLYKFLRRNPTISARKTEATIVKRMLGFS
jgi:hypothetical protein